VPLTEYIMLVGDGSTWRSGGVFNAYSATAAVQAYCKDNGAKQEEEYVAVPKRSWRPVKVEIAVEERVRVIPGQLTLADAES
jgi:hypothetical protein